MQTFKQKKIVLAVGASLLAMAGSTQAAVSVAERAVKPALITTALTGGTSADNAQKFYNGTGYQGKLTVQLSFTTGVSALTHAAGAFDTPMITAGADGFIVNGAQYNTTFNHTGAAYTTAGTQDDVSIFVGSGSTAAALSVAGIGFTTNAFGATVAFLGGGAVGTTATASVLLDSANAAGTGAFRLNTAGVLEWIANGATAWLPVTIQVNKAATAANAMQAMDRASPPATADSTAVAADLNWSNASISGQLTGANIGLSGATLQLSSAGAYATIATGVAQGIYSAIMPTPIYATKTPAVNAGLIDGVNINMLTPLTSLAATGISATTASLTNGATVCAANSTTPVTVTTGTATTSFSGVANATTSASTYGVTFSASATALTGDAAYKTACFNTGVKTGKLPISLDFITQSIQPSNPTYTLVFNKDTGSAATAANLAFNGTATALTDAAQPVVTKAEYTNYGTAAAGLTAITLTFSEPMALLTDTATAYSQNSNLREIAENIKYGGDSLAALNLNAGGNLTGGTTAGTSTALTVGTVANSGQSTLMINGVLRTDAVKALTVSSGIALKEPSDPNYSATVPTLDDDWASTGPNGVLLAGGLKSSSGAIEGATQMSTIALPSATATAAAFTAETARAVPMAAPNTNKIGTIIVTHGQTMNVPTAAALANYLIVTITGIDTAKNPVQFQFIPTAAQLTSITSTGFTINLPTSLVYANINATTGANVQYTAAGATAQVLMTAPAAPTVAAPVAAGNIDAVIPFSATPLATAFTTMDLKGSVTDAAVGDAVYAYLAKWTDAPGTSRTVTIGNGKVSNNLAIDRVAMDIALGFGAGAQTTLASLVKAELDAVAAAAPAVPGVAPAAAAVPAKQVPVYVQLARSNDAVQSGTATGNTNSTAKQQSLLAKAVLSTTPTDAGFTTADPIYAVNLDPVTGNISGRLTGNVKITVDNTAVTGTGKERGFHYLNASGAPATTLNASAPATDAVFSAGVVGTGGAFEFMTGANVGGGGANFNKLAGAFVILQHVSSTDGTITELTSADSGAANFVPFIPDLSRPGTRTTLPTLTLANVRKVTLNNSASWQLVGLGNPARAAGAAGIITPASFPRMFESSVTSAGTATGSLGFWTDHSDVTTYTDTNTDIAMAMAGNGRVGVATELSSGATVSNITNATGASTFVPGSAAIAFANSNPQAGSIYVTQGTAPAAGVKLPIGWSLVTLPGTPGTAVTTLGAGVKALIRVGAQAGTSQATWLLGETVPTGMVAGEAVFVYSSTLNGAL